MFKLGLKTVGVIYIFDILVKTAAWYGSDIATIYKPCYKGKSLYYLFKLSFKSNSEFYFSISVYIGPSPKEREEEE